MNKVLNFISDNNIQPEALFALVEKVRTMNLSDEQFERFFTLYSQQEKEFDPVCPTQHRTSA